MAIETGVPTSISQTYANPSAALEFAGKVIPQGRQLAQEDAKIDLLRMEQERQNKIAEHQIRELALKNALETALFDTRIEADKAAARKLILESELQQNKFDQSRWNEPRLGELLGDLTNVDHEKLARGDLDLDFNSRIRALRGIEAQEKATLAFNAQKERSFALIQQATNTHFDADIRERFNKDWANAAHPNKRSVLERYVNEQTERNLTNEVDAWNKKVGPVAPTLRIDITKLKGPDGRVNVGALRSALSKAKEDYNAAEKEVNDALADDNRRVDERTRRRDERLRSIEGSIQSLSAHFEHSGTARRGTGGGAQTNITPQGYDAEYAKQLEELHAERAMLLKQNPRREWDEYIGLMQASVANAVLATRQIESNGKLSPDQKKKAREQVEQSLVVARRAFEDWIDRTGASSTYDGSMTYNPWLSKNKGLAAIGK